MSQPYTGPVLTQQTATSPFAPSTPTLDDSTIDPIYGLGNLQNSPIFLGAVQQQRGRGQVSRGDTERPDPSLIPQSTSALKFMQQFAQQSTVDATSFTNTQIQLYLAGFYGSTKPRFGVYTTDDAQALKQAIQSYAGIVNPDDPDPVTFADYLDRASKQVQANGGNGPTRAPVQLTDPDELSQTLQQAAQGALGRDLKPDELSRFVDAFHGKERRAYNDEGSGHAVTQPDVSGEALTEVDQNHGAEEAQADTAGYLDTLKSMLGAK